MPKIWTRTGVRIVKGQWVDKTEATPHLCTAQDSICMSSTSRESTNYHALSKECSRTCMQVRSVNHHALETRRTLDVTAGLFSGIPFIVVSYSCRACLCTWICPLRLRAVERPTEGQNRICHPSGQHTEPNKDPAVHTTKGGLGRIERLDAHAPQLSQNTLDRQQRFW